MSSIENSPENNIESVDGLEQFDGLLQRARSCGGKHPYFKGNFETPELIIGLNGEAISLKLYIYEPVDSKYSPSILARSKLFSNSEQPSRNTYIRRSYLDPDMHAARQQSSAELKSTLDLLEEQVKAYEQKALSLSIPEAISKGFPPEFIQHLEDIRNVCRPDPVASEQ